MIKEIDLFLNLLLVCYEFSNMTPLNEQQRIEEIAQMLSGSNITKAALANARELLNVN